MGGARVAPLEGGAALPSDETQTSAVAAPAMGGAKVAPSDSGAARPSDKALRALRTMRTLRTMWTLQSLAPVGPPIALRKKGTMRSLAAGGNGAEEDVAFDVDEHSLLTNLCRASYLDPDSAQYWAEGPKGDGCYCDFGGEADPPCLRGALKFGLGSGVEHELLEFHNHERSDTQAFFAAPVAAPSELVISMRGTNGLTDAFTDLKFAKTLWEPEEDSYEEFEACFACCRETACGSGTPNVHWGAYKSFLTLKDALKRHGTFARKGGLTKITVCGHSLGGILATFAFAYLLQLNGPRRLAEAGVKCTLYTIGSGRPGNSGFKAHLEALLKPLQDKGLGRILRLVNDLDVIPRLPPFSRFGYTHVGELYMFTDSKREDPPHPGKALLFVGGQQDKANTSTLESIKRCGELMGDHCGLAYLKCVQDQRR